MGRIIKLLKVIDLVNGWHNMGNNAINVPLVTCSSYFNLFKKERYMRGGKTHTHESYFAPS